MELDDLDLAEKKPEKKHHRESKTADATPAAATPTAQSKMVVGEKQSVAAAPVPAPAPKVIVEEKKSATPPPAPAPTVIVEEKKSAPPPTAIVVAAVPPLPPLVATTAPAPVAAPPPAPVASAAVAPPPAAAPAPAIIDRSAPTRSDSKAMRNAGIIIGTVGIAALAAGGLWGLGAQNASNELSADAQSGAAYNPDLQTRGKRDQALEIAFFAGGGAALIGGTLLFALSPSQNSSTAANDDASENKLSLSYASVAPVPGGVSASAGMRF